MCYAACVKILSVFDRRIMDPQPSTPRILTPFNYVDWRVYMNLSLCKQGYFRIILGREVEPHHPAESNKFLNRLDGAFGSLCTHISRDILFHLEGLRTPKEDWENIEVLFGKNMSFEETF